MDIELTPLLTALMVHTGTRLDARDIAAWTAWVEHADT
jgi:hypothetical protein